MIKLIETGLFGDHLIEVNTPFLVKRYNACLSDIGLPNTKLSSFHIDGWGWSPEIAEELDNRFYLSHGLANPYGVIISPKQKDCALYMPYHSFDLAIHSTLFSQYYEQITDITSQCGLWFEIDQALSAYQSPQDLLLIDYVQINVTAVDRLMVESKKQKELIREFYDVPQAWSNAQLRSDIIKSSEKVGDLRYRKCEIPAFPYNEVNNYYSLAFDGLFVLKSMKSKKPVLIYANNSSEISGEEGHTHIEYNLSDPQLLSYLYTKKIVSDQVQDFAMLEILLHLSKNFLLVKAALEIDADLQIAKMTKTQLKGVLNMLIQQKKMPAEYVEIERIINSLDNEKKAPAKISDAVRLMLLHPSTDLKPRHKIVVWKILCDLNSSNPLLTYLFDKSTFYKTYSSWPEQLQAWVIQEILLHKNMYNQLITL